jgi:hypothetical protein
MDPASPLLYLVLAIAAIALIAFSLIWNRRSRPVQTSREPTAPTDEQPPVGRGPRERDIRSAGEKAGPH